MALLLFKKGAAAEDFALIWNDTGFAGCAKSTLASRPVTGTAIVNLLQSALDQNVALDGAWIYSTAAPTQACMGMARLQTRRGRIFYPTATGIKVYAAERRGAGMLAHLPTYWSGRADLWAWLALGGRTGAAWLADVKAKRLGNRRYAPMSDLQDKAATAAGQAEALAIWTGRASSSLVPFFEPAAAGKFDIVGQLRTHAARDEFFSLLAQELVYQLRGRVDPDSAKSGHNIGCVVVDRDWNLVAWGVNTNKLNGSFHGETNAVQAYERFDSNTTGTLPAGGTMYTSLEPCEMCSGVIRCAIAPGDTGFRLIYIQTDATLDATALKAADSPVRMTAATVASDVTASGLTRGRTFGAELAARQKALDDAEIAKAARENRRREQEAAAHRRTLDARDRVQPNHKFLAPTAFLREDSAIAVFAQAQAQRARMSAPLLAPAVTAGVRRTGQDFAAEEQLLHRSAVFRKVMEERAPGEIGTRARDDVAIAQANRLSERHHLAQQQRIDLVRAGGLQAGRAPARALDDFALERHRPRVTDPRLVELSAMLDRLSERFRAVFSEWMRVNEGQQTTAERARIVRQVSDFLARAHTATH